MDEWEQKMIDLLNSGEKLTERQLRDLLEYEIEITEGENRRWSRTNESICHVGDKYYLLTWEEGLTEMQPNEFYNQPYEVYLTEEEKTITIIERKWNKK